MIKILSTLSLFCIILLASCSDDSDCPKCDNSSTEIPDTITSYYYAGSVVMSELNYNGTYEPIYDVSSKLMMTPALNGYNIMIPMPIEPGKVDIELYGISINPKEAVVWSEGSTEHIENLPSGGSHEYNDYFSVTMNSSNSLTVYYKANQGLHSLDMPDLKIMVSPKVLDSFTEIRNEGVTWDTDTTTYNLPKRVAIKLVPNTFLVNYRPFYQSHLREI